VPATHPAIPALYGDQSRHASIRRELESPSDMTTKTIIQRIIVNSQAYEERQAKKVKSEEAYYKSGKQFVNES
jgi:hypothetical protein